MNTVDQSLTGKSECSADCPDKSKIGTITIETKFIPQLVDHPVINQM